MLHAWRERRAIRELLGSSARVEARRELRRTAAVRTTSFALAGDPSRYVVKAHRRASDARRETAALEALAGLPGVRAPRSHGAAGRFAVREFIEGMTLASLHGERGFTRCREHYATAVERLAAIHSARDAIAARTHPRDPFERATLRARLRRALARITRVGFIRYAARAGALPEGWANLGADGLVERLIEVLHTSPEVTVLGHGDYCAANLIVTPDGDLVAIDWDQLSLATPWRDLGRLLRPAPAAHLPGLLDRYRTALRRSGRPSKLSEARSLELLESGILYDALLVARMAAKAMRFRSAPRATAEFRDAIDTLVGRRPAAP